MNKGHLIFFFCLTKKIVNSSLSSKNCYNRNELKIDRFHFSFDHFTLLLVQVEKEERVFDGNSARSDFFLERSDKKKHVLSGRKTDI